MSDGASILRIAHPEEADEQSMKRLWQVCFPDDGEEFIDYYFRERTRPSYAYCAHVPKLAAMLHVIPMQFSICSVKDGSISKIPVGFVAGVATAPEYRKKGIAKALLRAAAHECSKNCMALMLSPVNEAFYRNYGYETVSYRCVHTLSRNDMPEGIKMISAGRAHWPSEKELLRIYYAFMAGGSFKTLYSLRTEEYFCKLLNEYRTPNGFAVANEGAYAFGYTLVEEGMAKLILNEFAYTESRFALSLIGELLSSAEIIRIPMTPGVSLPWGSSELQPLNMMCVLDAAAYELMGAESIAEYLLKLKKQGYSAYSFELY